MLTLMLLAILSLGARAQVTVIYGEKGETDNPYKFSGGTIEATNQTVANEMVTITLTVSPASGYTITKKDITVVSVLSPGTAGTRALEIAGNPTLDGDDPTDLSAKRDYTVTLDEGLGVWVQKAEFSNSDGTKGNRSDYSGTYFIANGNGYSSTNIANNFYLVPATNSNYATDQPHLTTTKSGQVLNCCWQIVKSGDYYRIIHVADGKYLTANLAYSGTSGNDVGRLRVHLEEMATPDDNTLFEIKVNSNGGYNIRHKDMADKINNSTTTYLDPAGGNVNGTNLTTARTATTSSGKINVGGGIGYWTDEAAARWRFEEVPQNNTYTYNIVDCSGRIAIKYTTGADQPAAKALSSYTDIPEAIRSPYLNGETVKFYTFSGDFSADKLSDENKITATPVTDGANIYVTYTTDHLADRFVKLHGASAFNITVNSKCIYDDSGLTAETDDFSSTMTTKNHLWYFANNDPYAVLIKNLDTGNLLQFDTTGPSLSVATDPINKFFIIMDGSTSGAGIANGQMELLAATGDATYYRIKNDGSLNIDNSTTTGDASLQVRAYPVSVSTRYHLIDKAGKLIEGNIESESSELGLPDEWKSPLVSEYHYYSTPNQTGDTYAPTGIVNSPFDATDIYVTYDVGNDIDITGGKNYMLKFLDGDTFNQEDEKDGINDTATPAIYPYNNGEFHLYVYGQKQWDKQLSSGASTRTRWLWHIFSNHDGNNLTGSAIDPYHVIFKSEQNQTVKDKQNGEDYNFPGNTYLRTYKPTGYASVVTDVAYESLDYHTDYPDKMPTQWVNGGATEYMILGTSMLNMKLKTFGEIDGSRQTVTSFEQYWKNNPTANNLLDAGGIAKVTGNEETVSLTTAQRTFLESSNASLYKDVWHSYNLWAYTKPWEKYSNGSTDKALKEGEHWLQTISMGSGEFTLEEISLVPQVILLDQHGWEIVRVPMYSDDACTVINTNALNKYNSPMVKTYHWYPKADKVSGYHKYKIKDSEKPIVIYEKNEKNKWVDSSRRYTHTSTRLSDIPYDHITDPVQDKSVKTDFYVTYTVEDTYARNYQGAATEEAVVPSSYLVKQGGNYATFSGSGTTIGTVATKPSRESVTDNILWNLKPNFKIDEEMGFEYGTGDASKSSIESAYYAAGQNGFDPYNVQIQSKAYPLRYFTTNTTGSALNGGAWEGTSSTTVTLQNLGTKYTATGYDQTTLNITNATFMVVSDGNGNMRLMPRFDHSKVMQSFGTLAAQAAAASEGDEGTGSQTLLLESVAEAKEIHSSDEITDPNGYYLLAEDFTFTSDFTSISNFTGVIDGQLHTLTGLTVPLIVNAQDAIIRNVLLKEVEISQSGNVGAICCTANGTTRIYNCGILPTTAAHVATSRSTVASNDGYCGSIVGYLDGYARVINCFSYANVTGGTTVAGIVGYNTTATMQGNSQTNFDKNVKTMVVNCMFYGDITGGGTKRPVYGGTAIVNNAADKVNNYNYYCEEEASYDDDYSAITDYNYSWPVAKKYLTRFEVYRNILNSNRRLCTWWVNGTYKKDVDTDATDENVESVGIAKWVLDRTIAPYPILKKWGKYYSTFDIDPDYVWNPQTKTNIARSSANPWQGKSYNTLSVTIKGGSNNSSATDVTRDITITDMDTLNYDYCAKKIQLPYYNEIFGNPDGTTWAEKYGNNYTTKVVTGWKVTSVSGGTPGTFSADWESGYNFADRQCTNKDKFDVSGRVFAQGGYYYVPDGVTAITIEAHWGNAVYLCNPNRRLDRINNASSDFYVSGKLPENVGGISSNPLVKTSLGDAVGDLSVMESGKVYDQAIVLVGNYQQNDYQVNIRLEGNNYDTNAKPFTIMSADFDLDNEPDFCFQAGMKDGGRENVQPIRFDFLMVPDLTMAVRTSNAYYGMRIFVPQGHFEITETSYMYTTQFEYDRRTDNAKYDKHEAPVILNGGEHMQIVSSENFADATAAQTATKRLDRTSYFLMGGNVYMKAFTPGCHTKRRSSTRHCAVNAIGGEFPELYLSGMFNANFYNMTDNPHAYLDGGWFGIVAGAGMESVGAKDATDGGDVTFKINHSRIREFYGGGINATRPVTGNINTTCDNSIIHKYCGGPKLGDMSNTKTITNIITNTVFDQYFGGGNGGTNMLRENKYDGYNIAAPSKTDHSRWDGDGQFTAFTPFKYEANKGYQAEFEFELLPQPQGNVNSVPRTYYYYASFSKTTVAPVTNTITDCTFNGNFYGGGNLGAVAAPTDPTKPSVSSTLKGHTVVHGSVFGAGFSASIPSFPVHDKGSVNYAYRDFAGFIHDGSLDYLKYTTAVGEHAVGDTIYYQWIHDVPTEWGISPAPTTSNDNRYFEYPAGSGKWYIYTTESLTGLGTVNGNATLTIKGTTEVMGDVFGGGAQSDVSGNTTVNIEGNTQIYGNVFGGGNQGLVEGSATVNIQ